MAKPRLGEKLFKNRGTSARIPQSIPMIVIYICFSKKGSSEQNQRKFTSIQYAFSDREICILRELSRDIDGDMKINIRKSVLRRIGRPQHPGLRPLIFCGNGILS
jgi:hypothetical protein